MTDFRSCYVGLAGRYLSLAEEEQSKIHKRIYERWMREASLLAAHGNGRLIDGRYHLGITLEDFVTKTNSRSPPVTSATIRRDLDLIKLHVGIQGLERYVFASR